MTTDTYAKALSSTVPGDATITWVAKGSGMIEPNMATMLVYIFTDAEVDAASLDRALRDAVHVSFNMLSVDTRHEHVGHVRDSREWARRRGGPTRVHRDAHRRLHPDDGDAGARRRGRRASDPRDRARRGERRGGAARGEVARQFAAREDDGARRRPERRATADGGRQVLRRASRSERAPTRRSTGIRSFAAGSGSTSTMTWFARRSPPKRSISRCHSAWAARRRRRTAAISRRGTSRRTRRITRARSRVSGLRSLRKLREESSYFSRVQSQREPQPSSVAECMSIGIDAASA